MKNNRATVKDFEETTNKYISQLQKASPKKAKEIATENLKKIGILTRSGNVKKKIVQGDYFGW